MEMHWEAYEQYMETCKNYEMESISFYQFIEHLTEEQLQEYCKNDI
ncbi:hypothetical protein QYG89_15250 [Bacillus sp. B190/17]|uniref:Transcriptional regulator n=1 Tax=Bacillus lumedeiriae TaxID=3058829 RepID=A0ABW8IBW9_9BACI